MTLNRNNRKPQDRDMVITRQTRAGGEVVKFGEKVRLKGKDADLLQKMAKAAEPDSKEAAEAIKLAKKFPGARDAEHAAVLAAKAPEKEEK